MWRTAWSEVRRRIAWTRTHPLATLLILATGLIGVAQLWLNLRTHFIDLDDYRLVSGTGRAELPETVGGAFALRLQNGERLSILCQLPRGRNSARRQYCVDHAYRAGLDSGERVTVLYLRPPRSGWDAPLLLSIRGAGQTYLSCADQLAVLGLRAARYQALCERGRGSHRDESPRPRLRPSPD
jgi:hypothetical protein